MERFGAALKLVCVSFLLFIILYLLLDTLPVNFKYLGLLYFLDFLRLGDWTGFLKFEVTCGISAVIAEPRCLNPSAKGVQVLLGLGLKIQLQ